MSSSYSKLDRKGRYSKGVILSNVWVLAIEAKGLKKAHPDADVYVTYMVIMSYFRDGEEFVRGVMENERVRYIRGRVVKVFPVNDRLIVRAEDTLMGIPLVIEAD